MARRPAKKAPRWKAGARRLGKWALQLAPALLLAAVILGPGERSAADPRPAPASSLDYAETVEKIFVPMNWLQFNEPDPDLPGRIVELTADALGRREVMEFYARSPLASDIAADDEQRWRIEGNSVTGLEPNARRVPGPFSTGDWFGSIRFGGGAPGATLVGDDGRRIAIRVPRRNPGPAVPATISIAPQAGTTMVDGQIEFVDEANAPLGRLRLIGRAAVVFPHNGASARLFVDTPDGRREAAHDPETGRGAVELSEGGAVEFVRDGRRLRRLTLGSVSVVLSNYRPFAGRFVDGTLGAFGKAISAAYEARGLDSRQDVQLTLDRDLQTALQAQLDTFLADQFPERAGAPPRAALTVMDSLNGEVLAMASARKPASTGSASRRAAEEARNDNLAALPIGSVAKVPVSAAILSQHPGLRGLKVNSTGAFGEVLGIDMEGEQVEEARAGGIDFTTYLAQSSNRFATTLMLLGLARDPWVASACPSEEYWLGDRAGAGSARRTMAPVFALERTPSPCGRRFAVPLGGALSSYLRGGRSAHWVGLLGRMFDLPGVEKPPIRYDLGPWRLESRPRFAPTQAFQAVSPQREDFRLGDIRQFHNDYINLILGGVHSRWTTVKVGEAYSRVVTGRRVEASFVRRGSRTAHPLALLPDAARESLLAGMAGAVRAPSGTAFSYLGAPRLWDAPPPVEPAAGPNPEEIRVFAKTGTPTLSRSRTVPEWVAIGNLAARRIIVIDSAAGGAPRLAVAGARPGESDADALARHPAAAEEARRQRLSLAALGSGLAGMRRELARAPREIRRADGLLSLPTTRLLAEGGNRARTNGGVIALVVGRYCRGARSLAPPQQALTLVINIQARNVRNPASLLAQQLLQPGSMIRQRLAAPASRCGERRT